MQVPIRIEGDIYIHGRRFLNFGETSLKEAVRNESRPKIESRCKVAISMRRRSRLEVILENYLASFGRILSYCVARSLYIIFVAHVNH